MRGRPRCGYSLLQLAVVYAIAGQRENAMATLDRVVKIPLFVTPGWLRIDPTCVIIQLSPAASPPPPRPIHDSCGGRGATLPPITVVQRSDRNPVRTSSVKLCGCSQAAKCPPLSSL